MLFPHWEKQQNRKAKKTSTIHIDISKMPGVCLHILYGKQYMADGKTPGGRKRFLQIAIRWLIRAVLVYSSS